MDLEKRSIKKYTLGTHRLQSPEETFNAVEPLFPEIGITRVADVTGLDHIGVPVCMCIRPNSKSLSVSQGKGITTLQAKVSAVMESLEAHYAQNDILDVIHASYNKLSENEQVVPPSLLNRPARSLYSDNMPIDWVRGTNIMDGTEVFVPYDLVHTRYLYHESLRPRCFISSTNGLASGNSIPEAVSHAICECIERDARALFGFAMHNPEEMGRLFISPDTIDSPVCRDLIEKLHSAGVSAVFWDETSDIGIPVCGCTIFENHAEGISHNSIDGLFSGFGCHLSREVALIRAITEAIQSRLTYISGARDDMLRSVFSMQQSNAMKQKSREFLSAITPSRDFSELPSLAQDSIEEDIQVQLTMLKKRGFSMAIAVELTPPSSVVGVVRVIIPGLAVDVHNGLYMVERTIDPNSGEQNES